MRGALARLREDVGAELERAERAGGPRAPVAQPEQRRQAAGAIGDLGPRVLQLGAGAAEFHVEAGDVVPARHAARFPPRDDIAQAGELVVRCGEQRDLLLGGEQGHESGAGLGGEGARAGGDARLRRLDLAFGALDARAAAGPR